MFDLVAVHVRLCAKAGNLPAERPSPNHSRCLRTVACRRAGQPTARARNPFEGPEAEGAANAPAGFKLQELAFGRQVCKRNDDTKICS